MIDIHTHILPGVDDGSPDFETSYELLKEEIAYGITDVILTPHLGKNKISIEELRAAFEEFKSKIDLNINLHLGCEFYYSRELYDLLKEKRIITLCDSKHVLVEFSTRHEEKIADIVYEIKLLGYIPIVAHIERYPYLTNDDYLEVRRNGGLIQINALSVELKDYKKCAKYLIKNDLVDFVASDCHNLRRNVNFDSALKYISKKNKSLYDRIVGMNISELK